MADWNITLLAGTKQISLWSEFTRKKTVSPISGNRGDIDDSHWDLRVHRSGPALRPGVWGTWNKGVVLKIKGKTPGQLRHPSVKQSHSQCIFITYFVSVQTIPGSPGGSVVLNLSANAGDAGSIPGSGRSHGEGNGNPLQYSWLGNPMDRRAWQAIIQGGPQESTRLRC